MPIFQIDKDVCLPLKPALKIVSLILIRSTTFENLRNYFSPLESTSKATIAFIKGDKIQVDAISARIHMYIDNISNNKTKSYLQREKYFDNIKVIFDRIPRLNILLCL